VGDGDLGLRARLGAHSPAADSAAVPAGTIPLRESSARCRAEDFYPHWMTLDFGAGVRANFAVEADLFEARRCPFHLKGPPSNNIRFECKPSSGPCAMVRNGRQADNSTMAPENNATWEFRTWPWTWRGRFRLAWRVRLFRCSRTQLRWWRSPRRCRPAWRLL